MLFSTDHSPTRSPQKRRSSFAHSKLGVRSGRHVLADRRNPMEDLDSIQCVLGQASDPIYCVTLLSGHGGHQLAPAVNEVLQQHVDAHLRDCSGQSPPAQLGAARSDAFLETDAELTAKPELAATMNEAGVSAVMVLVTTTHVVVANVGDVRCLLSEKLAKDSAQLAVGHVATVPTESQRITAAGGKLVDGRIDGGIALSRAFGHFHYKRIAELSQQEQLVTAAPSITVHERKPTDEFLLFHCSGVYDAMGDEQVRGFLQGLLKAGVKDPIKVCGDVLEECVVRLHRGIAGAVVVLFDN